MLDFFYTVFPWQGHSLLYIHSVTFIGYNEGRKCKHMVVLGTGLSFRYLTFVKLFILLSDCLPEIAMVTAVTLAYCPQAS